MQVVSDDGVGGVLVRVKAVPGASRSALAGVLGDRMKVRVAAPPEDGKANAALVELLASALGVRSRDVRVVMGASSAEKTVAVAGVSESEARSRLGV